MTKTISAALLTAIATTAGAAWPEKPIRIIVPYVPGGNIDITARTLAPGLGEALGQTIIVENRGGAGGTIGTEVAAKAPADGYTLLLGSSGTLTNAPALYPKLGYDPLKDFATTSMTTMVPIVIETHPSVPVKTVREFIALIKARPDRITMASAGSGSSNHLAGALFQKATDTRMVHVPYKGSGAALVDLMGGQVDVFFDQLSSSIGYLQAGKLRPIAVTTLKRSPYLPDVPSANEAGVPDASTVTGIALPAATPADIVSKLHAALLKVLRAKATRESFARFGAETLESTPEKFSKFIREDLAKWSKLVRETGIKLEKRSIQPAALAFVGRLKSFDRPLILACAIYVVEAFQQAFLAHRMDIEGVHGPVEIGYGLRVKINGQRRTDVIAQLTADIGTDRSRQCHRQQPVFAAVIGENVAEARRDHAADAEFVERIDRALARRTATEIAVRDDDAGPVVRLGVEDEFFFAAVGIETQVVKQHLRVLRPARHLVEPRRT